jgi:bifunctional DNA-binding transcriptional regulator/antitoxin component of YhaV-PrlF toxin-antitoxin module
MQFEMRTAVFKTRKESVSLRTTIPEAYVQLLKLKEGDQLEWDHDIVNGEIILKVKKVKK